MKQSFSKTICCSAADDESNGSSASLDDFIPCVDFEVKDEKRSFSQNNSSSKETECIMESKLARNLVMVLAILTGFAFMAFSDAKAAEFDQAEFRSLAFNSAPCCHLNQPALNNSRFEQWNQGPAGFRTFITNRDFLKPSTQAFGGNFTRDWDVTANKVPFGEFKVAFSRGFQNGLFTVNFVKAASLGREAFRHDALFEFVAFKPSTFERDSFNASFEIAEFAKDFAPGWCCKSVNLAGNSFSEFDVQFQTQA